MLEISKSLGSDPGFPWQLSLSITVSSSPSVESKCLVKNHLAEVAAGHLNTVWDSQLCPT